MQPPMDFHPFRTSKSWYDAYWLVPASPERPTPTGRLSRIVRFLFRVRPGSQDSRRPLATEADRMPAGSSIVRNSPVGQSLLANQ
jgi:hypothetical protein